jgi:hypothetical protein
VRPALPFVHYRIIEIPRWKLVLGAVLFSALLLAFFVLAAGMFLLVLPVAAIAGALVYLFGGRTRKRSFPDGVIEAEYREIESKQFGRDKQ